MGKNLTDAGFWATILRRKTGMIAFLSPVFSGFSSVRAVRAVWPSACYKVLRKAVKL
jgi:hypothetical protein